MNNITKKNQPSGFSLIEVLVALVILSVGLLGLAGLQATSLRANQTSLQSSQAAILAYDMADRVRANITNATTNYHLPAATPTVGCMTTAGCTAAQLAQNDMSQWNASLTQALPGGQGVICVDSTPGDGDSATDHDCDGNASGNLFAVKLWWDDDRDGDNQLFFTSFRP